MNDNDIIKALECCMQNVLGCRDSCPMIDKEPMEWDECQRDIMGKALGLIYRQKAELDRAAGHEKILLRQLSRKRENAIKEFAERLLELTFMYEETEIGTASMERAVTEMEINKVLKEMTGDEDA